nr:efflux RND transporter permease subunit [Sinorhizobium meliloti]
MRPFGSGNRSRHRRRSYQPCKVPKPDNSWFAHRQVADVFESTAPAEIARKDLSRDVRISSNIEGRALGAVVADLKAAMTRMDIPVGFRIAFGADAEGLAESTAHALQALVLAVIFIYIIVASQFGSLFQPIAIIMTMPLSLTGVLLGLLFTGPTDPRHDFR